MIRGFRGDGQLKIKSIFEMIMDERSIRVTRNHEMKSTCLIGRKSKQVSQLQLHPSKQMITQPKTDEIGRHQRYQNRRFKQHNYCQSFVLLLDQPQTQLSCFFLCLSHSVCLSLSRFVGLSHCLSVALCLSCSCSCPPHLTNLCTMFSLFIK